MQLMITGAAGYTGQGMVEVCASEHHVRGVDVCPSPTAQESVVSDLTDLDACRHLVEGMDAVVMCHMAKNPDGYRTPVQAMDVNVKGTANLYHAMNEQGVRRAVLISSTGVLAPAPAPMAEPGEGPYRIHHPQASMYTLSKVFQEQLACFYHATAQIVTTILRPGWIVYDGKLETKYGEKMERYNTSLIDPRDIGTAVLGALRRNPERVEAFHISSAQEVPGMAETMQALKWLPQYDFAALPRIDS